MRDLVFKNITSGDRKRKILASCETADMQGVHSVVRRHFIYIVKEADNTEIKKPSPALYVFKERNTKEQKENFFCRIKGSVYAAYNDKIFLILFIHSLRIRITAA